MSDKLDRLQHWDDLWAEVCLCNKETPADNHSDFAEIVRSETLTQLASTPDREQVRQQIAREMADWEGLTECTDIEWNLFLERADSILALTVRQERERILKDERQKMGDWLARETQGYVPVRSMLFGAIMLLRKGEAPWA